ncbi:hypothetical protein ACFWDG_11525, partial [Peribacillus sp. NPDC060186]
ATVIGLAQTLNMKDYRPLSLPLGMILVSLTILILPNVVQKDTFDKEIWPYTLQRTDLYFLFSY